jgi:ligand-binding SRPBCC domain-containing protein
MKIYTIHTKHRFPISINTAWDFLSNPSNLKTITPPNMRFTIISGADRLIYPGQIIQYLVTPIPGIRTKWVTEITHVKNKKYFVDEQRFGPYSFWHHKHFIHPLTYGIELEDIVDYKIPFGFFGQLLHILFIKRRLNKIFRFRKEKLDQLFGQYPE